MVNVLFKHPHERPWEAPLYLPPLYAPVHPKNACDVPGHIIIIHLPSHNCRESKRGFMSSPLWNAPVHVKNVCGVPGQIIIIHLPFHNGSCVFAREFFYCDKGVKGILAGRPKNRVNATYRGKIRNLTKNTIFMPLFLSNFSDWKGKSHKRYFLMARWLRGEGGG